MMPIVELAYSTVASASGCRNGGATMAKKMKIADRTDQRAHLGANQQALQAVLFLDPFVGDDLVGPEVEVCLCSHGLLSSSVL